MFGKISNKSYDFNPFLLQKFNHKVELNLMKNL